jgi:hypothetical protein
LNFGDETMKPNKGKTHQFFQIFGSTYRKILTKK